jgi:ATP adenylyltransferase
MPEFNPNIWAPWRMEYIRSMEQQAKEEGCFLCHYWAHPEHDQANHVLWRRGSAIATLNRFPYTNGHLLIAPSTHNGDISEISAEQMMEMMSLVQDAVRLLRDAVCAQGFNVGCNLGKCAGAGLPDHVHFHVVPRWNADTNFMAVLGNLRVVPDGLNQSYANLCEAADRIGLPVCGSDSSK